MDNATLIQVFGLAAEATDEQIEEAARLAAARPEPQGADKARLAQIFGLESDASDTDLLTAAQDTAAKAKKVPKDGEYLVISPEGDVVMTADQIVELREKAANGTRSEEDLAEMRFTDAFDRQVRKGHAAPAMREGLHTFFEADQNAALAHIEALPKIVSVAPRGSSVDHGQTSSPVAEFAIENDKSEVDAFAMEMHRKAETYSREHSDVSYEDAYVMFAEGRS